MTEFTFTNAKYIADEHGENATIKVAINGQEMFVPINSENRHYVAIQKWVAEDGGEIQAAD